MHDVAISDPAGGLTLELGDLLALLTEIDHVATVSHQVWDLHPSDTRGKRPTPGQIGVEPTWRPAASSTPNRVGNSTERIFPGCRELLALLTVKGVYQLQSL
jgi:hypothetical protein